MAFPPYRTMFSSKLSVCSSGQAAMECMIASGIPIWGIPTSDGWNSSSGMANLSLFIRRVCCSKSSSGLTISRRYPRRMDVVPGPNQKRNRSPELLTTTHKVQKKSTERQKLFNQNRPKEIETAIVETTNSFSLLSEDPEQTIDVSKSVTKPMKVSKPPPIILYGIEDVNKLTDFIQEAVRKEDYSYKIISRDQLRLSSKSIESYKILVDHIRNKGLIGHTFTRKEDRCQKIVIKDLHHTTPKEAIVEAIEATGNKVRGEIVNARKKNTKEPYNVFFVNLEPNENLPQVYREIYARKTHTKHRNENSEPEPEPKPTKTTTLDNNKWMPDTQEIQQIPQTTNEKKKTYREALIDKTKDKPKQRLEHTNPATSELQATLITQNEMAFVFLPAEFRAEQSFITNE
uniref:SFRICE_011533 n=1 Tax=Spodoptera frugiperda TaxID=7108 RepID=A0A2H1W5Y6_SPOFR